MEKSVVVSLRLDTEPKYFLLNRKTVREVDPAPATAQGARDQFDSLAVVCSRLPEIILTQS